MPVTASARQGDVRRRHVRRVPGAHRHLRDRHGRPALLDLRRRHERRRGLRRWHATRLAAIYLAGHTRSANFPVTAGAYDTTFNAGGFAQDGVRGQVRRHAERRVVADLQHVPRWQRSRVAVRHRGGYAGSRARGGAEPRHRLPARPAGRQPRFANLNLRGDRQHPRPRLAAHSSSRPTCRRRPTGRHSTAVAVNGAGETFVVGLDQCDGGTVGDAAQWLPGDQRDPADLRRGWEATPCCRSSGSPSTCRSPRRPAPASCCRDSR